MHGIASPCALWEPDGRAGWPIAAMHRRDHASPLSATKVRTECQLSRVDCITLLVSMYFFRCEDHASVPNRAKDQHFIASRTRSCGSRCDEIICAHEIASFRNCFTQIKQTVTQLLLRHEQGEVSRLNVVNGISDQNKCFVVKAKKAKAKATTSSGKIKGKRRHDNTVLGVSACASGGAQTDQRGGW